MEINKFKPTLASVVAIIGIVLGIPFGLYCLTLTGGASLGAVLVFGVVIGLVAVWGIDRAFVTIINPKKLSIIEFIVTLVCLFLYYLFQD